MRKLREILRLRLEQGLSGRAIARSCGISPATVSGYLGRSALAKLTWPLPPELDDDTLERLLFPAEATPASSRPEPEWAVIHQELQKRGVTKLLLWQEYREVEREGYGYSQFCERYLQWARPLSATMRQAHRAGEKCFIDFSGDSCDVIDSVTGEVRKAKLFVAVLGASGLTYVEPVFSEDVPTWIGCHIRAFSYWGGCSQIWVPDNLKAGVTRPDRYDPEINPTYAELATHYGAAVIPARVRKPRDKAKVEQAVLLAERWILAVLRHRTFYSLEELRHAVRELLDKLNDRPMRRLGRSRRQLFEELEREALLPLPERAFEIAIWSRPRVGPDYHVVFEGHFYSVPYQTIGEQLDLRGTETTVEVFQRGRRLASHVRSYKRHKYTTDQAHMPRAHRDYAEWTPERLLAWARKVGPSTAAFIEQVMLRRRHPEHGFKACFGILRLQDKYGAARIERASARGLRHRTFSYKSIAAILQHNLDGQPDPEEAEPAALPVHANVRGSGYLH
jgi:transposase